MSTQSTTTRGHAFQYPPLPAGVDGIRIIRIEPGEFSDRVVCTLTSVAFGAKPKYVALSYTWHDPYTDNAKLPTLPEESSSSHRSVDSTKEQGPDISSNGLSHQIRREQWKPESKFAVPSRNEIPPITLNNHAFQISHNLYLALLHLRSSTVELNLWVDAICINQTDIDERNAQVAIMSFIYMRATKVIGWLGIKEYSEHPGLFRKMAIEWKAGQTQHSAASLSQEGKLRRSLEPDQGTFAWIAKSSYWTRLWIVQEICIPRALAFVLGSYIWTFEDFIEWRTLKIAKSPPYPILLDKQTEALIRLTNARAAKYTDTMRLENLIENFANSGCSDWKDKVYGLFGLAGDICPSSGQDSSIDPIETYLNGLDMQADDLPEPNRGIGLFKVDYSRPLCDIWVGVVKFVFFRAKAMKRNFSFATKATSQNNAESLKASLLVQRERALTVVRTAGVVQEALGQNVEQEIASSNHLKTGPVIRAVGYVSGTILQVGPHSESLVSSFRANQEWINSWEEHYDEPNDLEALRRMAEDYTIKIIAYDKEDLDRIQELRNPGIVAWRMERSRPQSSELERSSAWHYANGTMTKLSEPRICLGTDRVMALVPSAAQAGDVIIQFWNCSAAVVMRPVLSGSGGPASSFLLVGRADVAEHPDSDVFSGIDQRAENKLLCVPESGASTFQSSGAVYVDLDFRTLSIITASIDSRRKI